MTITLIIAPAEIAAGASGMAALFGDIAYVRGLTRKGKQSNRISWVIFELVYGVTTAGLITRHSGWAVVLPATAVAGVSVILAVSLLPGNGTGGLDRRSSALIGGCGLAMAAWWFTRDSGVAVALAVTVELAGAALTVIDEFRNPSEPLWSWFWVGVAGVTDQGAVHGPVQIATPASWVLMGVTIPLASLLGRSRRARVALAGVASAGLLAAIAFAVLQIVTLTEQPTEVLARQLDPPHSRQPVQTPQARREHPRNHAPFRPVLPPPPLAPSRSPRPPPPPTPSPRRPRPSPSPSRTPRPSPARSPGPRPSSPSPTPASSSSSPSPAPTPSYPSPTATPPPDTVPSSTSPSPAPDPSNPARRNDRSGPNGLGPREPPAAEFGMVVLELECRNGRSS